MGGLERTFEGNDACEAEAGIEVDVENEDEDVVGGFAHVGLLGYKSEGFTMSEIVRRSGSSQRRAGPRVLLIPLTFHNVLVNSPSSEIKQSNENLNTIN